jgi:lipopolysaccharide/colanic/teichoic acid biosynthesis glycosyltransferase
MYRRVGKRVLDVCLAVFLSLVFAPLLLLIAIAVVTTMGRPVLFRQLRAGLNGRTFKILKFRTMNSAVNRSGGLLPDDARLTSLGRFLRNTSLDELPELINVIAGDMSFVGPRPLLAEYLGRYSVEQARRHEVLPGITGWAQINGRNNLSWDDKFRLDVWYVAHCSAMLDLRIFVLTIWKILKREGINEPGQATAAPFVGRQKCQ